MEELSAKPCWLAKMPRRGAVQLQHREVPSTSQKVHLNHVRAPTTCGEVPHKSMAEFWACSGPFLAKFVDVDL